MKSTFINSRNVALLVAAGILAGTGTAIAEETPVPTSSPTATTVTKPLTEYQSARAAYKVALEGYIANRKSSIAQYKVAHEAYSAARKSYNDARKPILETFKSELAAARSARDTALAAATTDAAKLEATTTFKAAVDALGAAPVKPEKPTLPTKPTAIRRPKN